MSGSQDRNPRFPKRVTWDKKVSTFFYKVIGNVNLYIPQAEFDIQIPEFDTQISEFDTQIPEFDT